MESKRVASAGPLHLDDLGAHLGEQHRGVGRRDVAAQVEHADPVEHLDHAPATHAISPELQTILRIGYARLTLVAVASLAADTRLPDDFAPLLELAAYVLRELRGAAVDGVALHRESRDNVGLLKHGGDFALQTVDDRAWRPGSRPHAPPLGKVETGRARLGRSGGRR